MNKLWLYIGVAVCVVGVAGCKRKAPEQTPEIALAVVTQVVEQAEADDEPVMIEVPEVVPSVAVEHLTTQVLAEDLVLYTLHIEFDTDQAVIQPVYFADLEKIGKALTRDPQATARIEGHADRRNTSVPDHNLQLSRRRAVAVADCLKTRTGIAAERLATAGFGFDRPLEPNDPVSGSVRNRRVEVFVGQGVEQLDAAPAPVEVP